MLAPGHPSPTPASKDQPERSTHQGSAGRSQGSSWLLSDPSEKPAPEKKNILSAEVLQRLGAHVARKGVLGKLPPRAAQRVSASPVVWLRGVTSGPFRVRFGQGNTATGKDSPPATQCQEPKPCSCNLSKVPHTGQSGNPATGCELGQDADQKLVLN